MPHRAGADVAEGMSVRPELGFATEPGSIWLRVAWASSNGVTPPFVTGSIRNSLDGTAESPNDVFGAVSDPSFLPVCVVPSEMACRPSKLEWAGARRREACTSTIDADEPMESRAHHNATLVKRAEGVFLTKGCHVSEIGLRFFIAGFCALDQDITCLYSSFDRSKGQFFECAKHHIQVRSPHHMVLLR
jgi:hypothetical protein